MSSSTSFVDLLIVGAGPAGLTARKALNICPKCFKPSDVDRKMTSYKDARRLQAFTPVYVRWLETLGTYVKCLPTLLAGYEPYYFKVN
jgi:2-polyprenyl-6-methoxyphenol hydroxylase-like FAD-dependent oxidoreductase